MLDASKGGSSTAAGFWSIARRQCEAVLTAKCRSLLKHAMGAYQQLESTQAGEPTQAVSAKALCHPPSSPSFVARICWMPSATTTRSSWHAGFGGPCKKASNGWYGVRPDAEPLLSAELHASREALPTLPTLLRRLLLLMLQVLVWSVPLLLRSRHVLPSPLMWVLPVRSRLMRP